MSAKVAVRDLRKRYGGVEAAAGVSFEIHDGEIFGLLGPNGAGKTTAVECVIGLRRPDAGTIEICGLDARRQPRAVKQKIGAALQTTALQDKITPREALALFGAFYAQRADPDALLDRFSLRDKAHAPFDTLSGGQRQRLALALAFVNHPELVFLDEPTTGLDPQSRLELHAEIARMKQDGHTVLLTTHYIDEANALCDRVAIIDRGRIIAVGAPEDLIAASRAAPTVSFTTSRPLSAAAVASLAPAGNVTQDGAAVRFPTTDVRRTLGDLLAIVDHEGVDLTDLHVQKTTLEGVFLELTGSDLRD
jgi:ABC-2 type transport system ATP-binding protein